MKLITMGDSITVGTYTAPGQEAPMSIAHPNYTDLLQAALGCEEMENYGMNGTSASNSSDVAPEEALCIRCVKYRDADYVVIAIGTNDFGTNVELGKPEDSEKETFYGALRVIFSTVKENNPNAKIVVLSPLPRIDEEPNKKGYILDDYRNALKQRAAEWEFVFVDGRQLPICPTDPTHKEKYIFDGVHFNEDGHKFIAELLLRHI